ncbi:cell division protein FtsQ/DivIB, partial [Xylella fastidiosa subsp. multiplex]|nr:cell division protein FtsQ/DivIB [Xylella fastidiosa subsp. multiplex]
MIWCGGFWSRLYELLWYPYGWEAGRLCIWCWKYGNGGVLCIARLECRGMNVVLRILAWLLAVGLVVLPVVAVLNGWVGAERWPLAKLRVSGDFKRVSAEELRAVVLP